MSFYGRYPGMGGGGGGGGVTSLDGLTGALTLVAGTGISIVDGVTTITISSTSAGDVTLTAFGSTPNANAASLTGQALTLQPASGSFPGGVSTTTQSFAGAKTFVNQINADGGIDRSTVGTLTIGATNSNIINIGNSGATVNIQGTTIYENTPQLLVADPLITLNSGGGAGSGQNSGIQIEEAASITGYAQTSSDRNSWIFKAPNTAGIATLTPGVAGFTIDQGSHNPVTIGTANGLSLATQVLSLGLSSTSTTGALSSTDWNTFNGKQAAGNYITALTGDATATGPGSVALTLATVNSNVGTFASVTVNAKGLVTAATALSGDATTSGAALTLATVNGNVGSFGSATQVPTFTVNAKGLITAAANTTIIGMSDPGELKNIGIVLSVAANALTISIRDNVLNGTPSATSPVVVSYRQFSANLGTYAEISLTSALSIVIPSGTTLGTNSGVDEYLYVYLLNLNGTTLAAVSCSDHWDEAEPQATTAIAGGNDAATLYTTAAQGTPRGCRLIGRIKSNQATAGTWASAPTEAYVGNQFQRQKSVARAISFIPKPQLTYLVDCSATRTISLPTPRAGWWTVIKDATNQSGANAITLARNGSEKIDNTAANYTMSVNGGAWRVWSDGTDWFITAMAIPTGLSNALTNAHILVGNSSNIATDVAASGDLTLANTGAFTFNTVNGNVGSFGSSTSIPSFTVNAKGLITAASGNAVIAPAGTLTGTTLNATVVTSSLTAVGTITTGVWTGTAIAAANGGTGITSYTKGDTLVATGATTLVKQAVGTDNFGLIADSAQTNGIIYSPMYGPGDFKNIAVQASVTSNTLIVGIGTSSNGAQSSTNFSTVVFPVYQSAGTDTRMSVVRVTSQPVITVPNGATLGHRSAVSEYIYVYLINNAGTVEMALSSTLYDTGLSYNTTTIDTASDSATGIYSTTGRTGVAMVLIGRILVSEATAGTWATNPTKLALWPFKLDNPSGNLTAITRYTTGSGTFTPDPRTRQLRIRMIGAGAGGTGGTTVAANNAGPGGAGGDTTFGTSLLTAKGAPASAVTATGPGGVAGTVNSPAVTVVNAVGGGGVGSDQTSTGDVAGGGSGGYGYFGGGGAGQLGAGTGTVGGANTGGGGAGGRALGVAYGGTGGGSGNYVEAIINAPNLLASYSYAVGAGGAGGTAGTGGQAGGAGADGVIIIEEVF